MPEISNHALRNIVPNETWNIMGRMFMNPWSENNPDGIVVMGIAENKLMYVLSSSQHLHVRMMLTSYYRHSEIATFLKLSLRCYA